MRLSPFDSTPATDLGDAASSNGDFFRTVAERVGAENLPGAILLVGGNDFRARALRYAQGALRMDRRPSRWSHAALVTEWAADPAAALGVEVTLHPADDAHQVPERNGVTSFRLERYLDEGRFPNVALAVPIFRKPKRGEEPTATVKPADRRKALVEAATRPNRDRERYPLWDLLATWARFAYAPDRATNPLLEGTPMPSAALCEYAYEVVGADLTPGATGNHSSPEVLYATLKHWSGSLDEMAFISMQTFTKVRDEHAAPGEALSAEVADATQKAAPARSRVKKALKRAAKKIRKKKKSRR